MNAQRTDENQKVWVWSDFFPDPDAEPPKPRSAKQIAFEFDRAAKIIKKRRGR